MDNHLKQINRLIKKDLFDERIKKQRQEKKNKKRNIVVFSTFILIALFLSALSWQILDASYATNETKKEISQNKPTQTIKSILPSQVFKKEKPEINILALGRPGDGYSGGNLTDTIILIHLKQNEESDSGQKAFLISLPRDLLVQIPNRGGLTKINALYSLVGIEWLKEKIYEITGLAVDHHIIVDLAVVEEVISLVDGLNVFVEQDINDPYFPGPNYSYQTFNLSAGWRYLNGATALRYIRTRYTSPNGDFDRMSRQQQVIQLLKQKVLALNPLWDFPTYVKIFSSLQSHIETDLGIMEMKSFWQTAQKIGSDNISSIVIDKKETGLLIGGQVPLGQYTASVVYPKAGQENYNEIRKFIEQIIK
ncbi:MAG: LCP family protein [Candidatus Portnoybacteria bacterium]|nr:LCP family protein [Candidatus Portnoybacteria bacterium]